MKFPSVVAVLCVVPPGLTLYIGITSCTFPPFQEKCLWKKNDFEKFCLVQSSTIETHIDMQSGNLRNTPAPGRRLPKFKGKIKNGWLVWCSYHAVVCFFFAKVELRFSSPVFFYHFRIASQDRIGQARRDKVNHFLNLLCCVALIYFKT